VRDVEEMLAQRGIEVSHETVRCWALQFGRAFARNLLKRNGIHPGRFRNRQTCVVSSRVPGASLW